MTYNEAEVGVKHAEVASLTQANPTPEYINNPGMGLNLESRPGGDDAKSH